MKSKILTFILIISFPFIGFPQSQNDCGTSILEQSTTYEFVQKQRAQTIVNIRTTAVDVPIKVHIVGANMEHLR